jgi:hypothetical protein
VKLGWQKYLELVDVIIVQIEVVDHEAAVEHPRRKAGQKILTQVQLINPLVIAAHTKKGWFNFIFNFT